MATTVTPPVSSAPAPAPAPAAPAPAPAPAPAAAPAPAPSQSPAPQPPAAAQPSAPAQEPGSAQPPAPVPPAAPGQAAGQAPAGPPKASDFPENEEGVEQFIEASERWRQEHPDERLDQPAQVAPEAGAQPEEAAAARQPEPQEQPQAQPGEAPPLPTPQAFEDLLSSKPDFKALFERDPEAKTQVMDLARAAEAARPVLEIVPTVEEARFATGKANEFLNLQHAFAMAAENPEMGERGWNQFVDLFTLRDEKGQPIVQNGMPQLAESFDFIGRKFVGGAMGDRIGREKTALEALQKRLESGVYPSEQLKEADRVAAVDADYRIKALEYVQEMIGEAGDQLSLPDLPADATQAQRELQAELAKQLEQVNANKQANSKQARVQARMAFERKVNGTFGQNFGDFVDNLIKARRDRGEYIPDFVLTRKWVNPATRAVTDVPTYAAEMWNAFQTKIHAIPSVAEKLRNLELQGQPAEQQRVAYFSELVAKYAPGIERSYMEEIHRGIRGGQASRREQEVRTAQVARVEPQSASAPTQGPQPLSGQALQQQALENLRNNPEYQQASRVDRAEMEMLEAERLRSGRR